MTYELVVNLSKPVYFKPLEKCYIKIGLVYLNNFNKLF